MRSSTRRKFSAQMTAAISRSCGQPFRLMGAYMLSDSMDCVGLISSRKQRRDWQNFTRCSSPLYCCMPQGRTPMAVESIFYSVAGMSCRGALIWDDGVKAPRPLLLMAPNWRGVIKPAIETGQMLAGEGYVVFVADMFGEGNV